MQCPYCKKEIELPQAAVANVNAYQKSVRVTMPCCLGLVVVSPVFSVDVRPTTSRYDEDDWGVTYKKDAGCLKGS